MNAHADSRNIVNNDNYNSNIVLMLTLTSTVRIHHVQSTDLTWPAVVAQYFIY